jgi:hypothetical protein
VRGRKERGKKREKAESSPRDVSMKAAPEKEQKNILRHWRGSRGGIKKRTESGVEKGRYIPVMLN